jgi:hypothetical protein
MRLPRHWKFAMRLTLLLITALLGVAWSHGAEPGAVHKKILLIGHAKDSHPPRTHEYLEGCKLLAKCLVQTPGVETVVWEGWPADPAQAGGAAAIVLYVPWGANVLFDGPQRDLVKKQLVGGAGLVAIHWSTGAQGAEYGQLWLDQLGAWFHSDFSKIHHLQRRLKLLDPQHAICRGLQDFNLFDELYFNLHFADAAQPLVQVDLEGTPQTIAWTYQRPNSRDGRSFGCVAGHYHKNFGNDLFRKLLINGILWTAHVEVPPHGAPCRIEPRDLALASDSDPVH